MAILESSEEEMEMELQPAEFKIKDNILDKVAHSNGFFKSQQIGEKDLTFDEKRQIAEQILDRNLVLFLQRYWKFLSFEDTSFFNRDDYEVNFYVEEIRKHSDMKKFKLKIKNRRYEALQRMITEGSYFSDKEMRERNPFLYEQFIGQHLTEEEKNADRKADHENMTFSGFLMQCIEKGFTNRFMQKQQDDEEAAFEEEDDESDEEEESQEYAANMTQTSCSSEAERQMLRNEFTNIMYESFLAGKDHNFDYSSVDENAEYDSVHQREIDEEEKYFDQESPESVD